MKILIISLKDPNTQPQLNNQILHLSKYHEVSVIGTKKIQLMGVKSYETSFKISYLNVFLVFILNFFGFYDKSYEVFSKTGALKKFQSFLLNEQFDCIIAQDIHTLPFAFSIKNNAKLIFNALEYFPDQTGAFLIDLTFKKSLIYYGRKYIGQCDLVLTVGEKIALRYYQEFNIRPIVILNSPQYKSLNPHPVKPEKIKIIHHGDASPNRKIESMIEMMKYTDQRFSLSLMLVTTTPRYTKKLKTLATGMKNVQFLDPVPMSQIIDTISTYDIGLYILEPSSFNNLMALPNKFFEFIQARLAIAIGPSPEMAKIVHKFDLGIVAEDFDPKSMASLLNTLSTEKIQYYRQQCNKVAYEFSADTGNKILDQQLETLFI